MAADMCLYDVAYCIVDRAATPFSSLFQIRTVFSGSRTVMRLLFLGGGSETGSGSAACSNKDCAVFLSSREILSLPYRMTANARNDDCSLSDRPNTLIGLLLPFSLFIRLLKNKAV